MHLILISSSFFCFKHSSCTPFKQFVLGQKNGCEFIISFKQIQHINDSLTSFVISLLIVLLKSSILNEISFILFFDIIFTLNKCVFL